MSTLTLRQTLPPPPSPSPANMGRNNIMPSCILPFSFLSGDNFTVKKIYRIPVFFFTKPFRNGKTPMVTRDFWYPPEKEFFVFWGGKSIPLSAGVIFSSLLKVMFPYFPYFPIKFTGKFMEDSWLATGAPGRVAIKFGHWEKNSAPFVKLQVWKSVNIIVNQSYYHREN